MFNSFTTALSALNATSTAVDIVGNNLANLNTTGYKGNTVHFADLMSQELGSGAAKAQVGYGVSRAMSSREFTQGSVQQTTGSLDAAIKGNGFFVVRDYNNQTLYTRAGNFSMSADGFLQSSTGEYVQGWSAVDGVVNPNSAVGDISLPLAGVLPAIPTQNMSVTVNLNANAVVDAASGEYTAPMQVVDSLGGVHTLSITFTKTDTNSWDYAVTIPDADLGIEPTTPPTPPTPLTTGSLTFDGTGKLTASPDDPPIEIEISGLVNGADDLTVNWNLFENGSPLVSQFVQASGVSASHQDGIPAGQITKVGIADGGFIVANFSNGQQTVVGQLAMASIQNPGSLLSVGNNNLQATIDTATPAVGTAESGGRGQIQGSSLESSTVDIATEFTNLITYQRSYQANSRVISTADQMTQDLIGLIR